MMTEAIKLDGGQKNLLRLAAQGADAEGWAPVSKPVFPLLERIPAALVELARVGEEGRGRVRLTQEGEKVVDAMAWLGG